MKSTKKDPKEDKMIPTPPVTGKTTVDPKFEGFAELDTLLLGTGWKITEKHSDSGKISPKRGFVVRVVIVHEGTSAREEILLHNKDPRERDTALFGLASMYPEKEEKGWWFVFKSSPASAFSATRDTLNFKEILKRKARS